MEPIKTTKKQKKKKKWNKIKNDKTINLGALETVTFVCFFGMPS